MWDGTTAQRSHRSGSAAFQSTHPVWDGTRRGSPRCRHPAISIHPSRVGWDSHDLRRRLFSCISIHPSRVGWDRPSRARSPAPSGFQSTHPVWDGTLAALCFDPHNAHFNPPIPCGMGPRTPSAAASWRVISIHPSRVGWDPPARRAREEGDHFNPPIPCGMGHVGFAIFAPLDLFQSTHPVWDGTGSGVSEFRASDISIHPSRVGWDDKCPGSGATAPDFNPPIPCGMGLDSRAPLMTRFDFNPPIPCGMGPNLQLVTRHHMQFQSTHPVWDGTAKNI